MKTFSSNSLTTGENYKVISGLIVPRSVAWISTLNENGTINLAPFSFFSSVPSSRPIITLGIGNKNEIETKDTVRNILREKEAVIHIASEESLSILNATAATTPYGESEVISNNIKTVQSAKIKTPAIAEPKVRFETKLYKAIPVKDFNGQTDAYVLLMEVVNYIIDEDVLDDHLHTNIDKLAPIIRLSGPNYGKIGKIYSLNRPDHNSQPS